MAMTIGTEYDHIDITNGVGTVRHPLKDSSARELANNLIKVQNTQPESDDTVLWVKETPDNEVEVPTYDEFNELKSAIESLDDEIFEGTAPIDSGTQVNQIAGATYKAGSASASTGTPAYISINNSSGYDSYYFFPSSQTDLWFDSVDSRYLAICYGADYTSIVTGDTIQLYCSNPVRYRKSDNNLPTESSKLTARPGSVVVITVTAGGTDIIYGLSSQETFKQVKNTFAQNTQKAGGLYVNIGLDAVTLSGKAYNVKFEKIATTQGYQWNITQLYGAGNNVIPTGTDIIGVIKMRDAAQFIGGIHGNELNVDFRLFSKGTEISSSGYYPDIGIYMYSHLYDYNDPASNIVDRYVLFDFTPDGWTARNTFKMLTSLTVQNAYASGLFGFNKADVDFAACNFGEVDLTTTESQFYASQYFKKVIINFADNLTACLKSNTCARGFFTYRSNTQSFKAYFSDLSADASLQSGDCITGEYEYAFY